MKRNRRICLMMTLLLLGTYNVFNLPVVAEDIVPNEAMPVEADEIKVNKETLEKANVAISNKDYQSAIVYLTAYIQAKPKKYEAYKLRGEAFYALRQYKLAQNDFQTAIDLKTADDKFLTGTKVVGAIVLGADKSEQYQNPELGLLYGDLMYAQKALNNPAYETTYKKAFEYNSHQYLPQPKKEDIAKINCPQKYGKILNPSGIDSYIYGAIDDIELGKFHEAAYKTQYITQNYPKYYLGHYLTGVVMAGLEQENDAIEAFKTSLKYNPYDFESYASLGQIYYSNAEKTFSQDDAKKSIENFDTALKYNPNCYIYYFYIGLNNLLINNNDEAISSFDKAIKYKTNDYNSMYYKAIAQFEKGDYHAVVDSTTKLLYRHVSNYNSVLYLRALAEYKVGSIENALADIEKIDSNINDIYNLDVRVLSPKEKTLDCYLSYLKAQILEQNGQGAKSDLEKAFSNPIIRALASEHAVELVVPPMDLENQYDYLRTSFDMSKISLKYQNPDYVIASNPQPEEQKVISEAKNPQNDIEQEGNVLTMVEAFAGTLEKPKDVATEQKNEPKITMKQSTDPLDMISNENQVSIAQLLASQSLNGDFYKSNSPVLNPELISDASKVEKNVVETQPQTESANEVVSKTVVEELPKEVEKKAEVVETKPSEITKEVEPEIVVLDSETFVFKAPEQKSTETFNIKYDNLAQAKDTEVKPDVLKVAQTEKVIEETSNIVEDTKKQVEDVVQEKIVITSPVQKKSEDFTIRYDNAEQKKVTEKVDNTLQTPKEIVQQVTKVEEIVEEANPETIVSDKVEPIAEKERVVVEKHADVDLSQFNVAKTEAPVIKAEDEVIVLEKPTPIFNEVRETQTQVQATSDKILEDIKNFKDEIAQDVAQTKEQAQTIVSEASSDIVTRVSEPSLVVPDVLPIAKAEEVIETVASTVDDAVSTATADVEQVETDFVIPTVDEVELDEVVEENVVTVDETKKIKKHFWDRFKKAKSVVDKDIVASVDEVKPDETVEETVEIVDKISTPNLVPSSNEVLEKETQEVESALKPIEEFDINDEVKTKVKKKWFSRKTSNQEIPEVDLDEQKEIEVQEVAPDIEESVQKPKKSLFDFLKFKKKTALKDKVIVDSDQFEFDELTPPVSLTEPVEEPPVIRLGDVEEDVSEQQTEVEKPKKKFSWFKFAKKSKTVVDNEIEATNIQDEVVETQEKKVSFWKKFFNKTSGENSEGIEKTGTKTLIKKLEK